MSIALVICMVAGASGKAQTFDVEQLVLDVQKLEQLKQILTDLKEGYQILDKGYSTVRDLAKGSFNLHEAFLDGLLAVSPVVRDYQRVKDIVSLEVSMLGKYQAAWAAFQSSGHFRPEELQLLGQVYSNLFAESAKGIGDLVTILTDGSMRASDAERMEGIDGIYNGMLGQAVFLDRVNNGTALLGMQRQSELNDVSVLQVLYGINP
jgi:hypothetical protein